MPQVVAQPIIDLFLKRVNQPQPHLVMDQPNLFNPHRNKEKRGEGEKKDEKEEHESFSHLLLITVRVIQWKV